MDPVLNAHGFTEQLAGCYHMQYMSTAFLGSLSHVSNCVIATDAANYFVFVFFTQAVLLQITKLWSVLLLCVKCFHHLALPARNF